MRSRLSAPAGLMTVLILIFAGACATHRDDTAEVTPAPSAEQPSPGTIAQQTATPRSSPLENGNGSTPRAAATVAEPVPSPPIEAKPVLNGTPPRQKLEMNPAPNTTNGIGAGVMEGPGEGGGNPDNPHPIRKYPIDYNATFTGREVDRKARIIEKPEPGYTATARQHEVTGTVILKTIFAANGQVTNIQVEAGLPDGLNDLAVAAAKRIKFTPALINGRPVSMYMQLQYNFNLY
ncbi:MAG TPA: TonB family protein [Pyrinomonadaceae bacterium]|nr:TonB family protein [Pyrinomonadaceae bacterium]